MGKNEDGHFWRMVFAALAVAVVGAVALTRSFRTSRDGGRSWEKPPAKKGKAAPKRKPVSRKKKV
jgi:hypothetical protein